MKAERWPTTATTGPSWSNGRGDGSPRPEAHRHGAVAEVFGAVMAGSPALLADAGHILTPAAGLVPALIAARLVNRPATKKRT